MAAPGAERYWQRLNQAALAAIALGVLGCIVGIVLRGAAFFPAWLCAYWFWLGVPLGAVTLVLVHDLTGGEWMASARPVLNAAIATMPVATLAGIPVFIGLDSIYAWPTAHELTNRFYLNPNFVILRYAIDVVVWNLLAAFALWAPRGLAASIVPGLSWISAVGLLVLAYTAGFAAIDWGLSLEPRFWSAIFPMIAGSAWFDTSLALVLLVVALAAIDRPGHQHMANIAAILLATIIFWAYVEFCQMLIVWEEDLKSEIPWYLHRIRDGWQGVTWIIAITGFFIPFFTLLWSPAKRSRVVVIAACAVILFSRLLYPYWLVLPEFPHPPAWWLDVAATLALGGGVMLLFLRRLRYGPLPVAVARIGEAR